MAKDLIPTFNFVSSVEAIAYYEQVFGATDISRLAVNAEMAENFGLAKNDPDLDKYTVHGGMHIFGLPIYYNDIFDGSAPSTGLTLLLAVTSDDTAAVTELEALWQKVVASGQVTVKMDYGPQFWGGKLGLLVDKFGIIWQFAVNEQM